MDLNLGHSRSANCVHVCTHVCVRVCVTWSFLAQMPFPGVNQTGGRCGRIWSMCRWISLYAPACYLTIMTMGALRRPESLTDRRMRWAMGYRRGRICRLFGARPLREDRVPDGWGKVSDAYLPKPPNHPIENRQTDRGRQMELLTSLSALAWFLSISNGGSISFRSLCSFTDHELIYGLRSPRQQSLHGACNLGTRSYLRFIYRGT
jgi:hypothetical protein